MTPAGLILAGGASTRMGTAKALLPLRGETFLDRLIGVLGAHCDPVIVVLGHGAEAIRASLRREALLVVNERWPDGQLTSLQCGLRAVPREAAGVMFTPVDCPAVEEATVAAIARRFRQGDAALVIPRFEGRRGHPVCCSRALAEELLALPADSQARVVIHRHADQACYVDVVDRGVVLDIDDRAAYDNLIRGAERE